MIWVYTNKGGIKTIIWTDTLQTSAMLICVIASIILITAKLDMSLIELFNQSDFKEKSKILFLNSFNDKIYFWKYFIGGAFITIAMTGLDQDMMQKNLACKNINDAKKNMLSMSVLLVIVNFVFLTLGALLFMYASKFNVSIPVLDGRVRNDLLFPEIAMNQNLGTGLSITFIIGLIAAAYSSADSALTSLTTSFSVDFLDIKNKPLEKQKPIRKKVHIGVSLVLILVVLLFNTLDGSVVSNLFKFATFTYGPLLGLFTFGIVSKRPIRDQWSWLVGLASIAVTYGISELPKDIIGDYLFHWELLPINGLITCFGLFIISKKPKK